MYIYIEREGERCVCVRARMHLHTCLNDYLKVKVRHCYGFIPQYFSACEE